MSSIPDRRNIRSDAFWGAIERSAHILQVYGNENVFLDALEGFVGSGLRVEEAVVVVASATHLHELEKRLRMRWIEIDRARFQQRYIPVLSQETLLKFMVGGFPDAELFAKAAGGLIARARGDNRKVRVFVEMIEMLWGPGKESASVQVERLWAQLAKAEGFPLFCAYAKETFERHVTSTSAKRAEHSLLLPG